MRQYAVPFATSIILLFSASASASGSSAARAHFRNGARAYDVGDYDLAKREFQAAYEASGHPDLLYNIYTAAERLGELEEAREALTSFLRDAEIEAERRVALEQRLARLDARIAQGETEPEPTAPSLAAPPPSHAASPAPPPVEEQRSAAPVALLSTSAGLLVGFGVFAGLSAREDRRLDDRCGVACTDDEVVRLKAFSGLADASWIAATLTGALGITLFVVQGRRRAAEPPAPEVAVLPLALARGGGLALEGRF